MTTKPRYYKNTRSEMLAFFPEQYKTVLEVGCGEGQFSRNFHADAEIWGIEPATDILHPMYRTFRSGYDEAATALPDNYFDLVVCNDVIEHMPDHDDFFSSIYQKLKPGGVLVASIPNVRYYKNLYELLLKKDWRYKDSGILDRTHLRFFTEKSLRRSLAEQGYSTEKFAGINGPKRLKPRLLLMYFLTLFSSPDIRHMQFGFQAQKRG